MYMYYSPNHPPRAGCIRLPDAWSRLRKLESLAICNNRASLTGALPTKWAALICLKHLDVSVNGLSGGLPSERAALGCLEALDLSRNVLHGVLPAEWGALRSLERLNLAHNDLYGKVPAKWANLGNLRWLNVGSNRLRGLLPTEWTVLTRLEAKMGIQNLYSTSLHDYQFQLYQRRVRSPVECASGDAWAWSFT